MIISPYRNMNLVKRDLYDEDSRESTINSNIFEEVDKHSSEVITHNYETFEDFIRNLIFLKDFDDTQKTRAIFRWITMNDLKKINLDQLKSGSAEEAIYLFINGNIDHAELFSVLLWKVGIRCEIIEGLTKDPLSKRGDDKLTPRRWNAVLIDRQWKLIDICWSQKYFCDEFTRPTSSSNEFYFFSNPKHLIFTHFPANLEWQLLNPAIQQETFLSFPVVNSKFFKYNFKLMTPEGVVETYNGSVVIRIGHENYPGNNLDNNCISYTFNHIDSNEIKDHVLQETKTDEEIFHIRCPLLGAYHFTINHDSSSSPNPPKHKRTLNHAHFDKLSKFQPICQYKIICHANPKPRPFPMSHATIGWGSHLLPLKRFKILPSHTSAVLTTRNKMLDLFFRKLRSEVRMYALMFKSGQSSKEFRENVRVLEKKNYYKENCGAVDPKTDTPQVLVSMTLPHPDEYCLEIYANDPNIDGNNFVLICRHIVIGHLGRESSIMRDDVSKHLHRSIPSNLSWKEETFPGDDNDSNQRKVQKVNSFEHEELRQTRVTISDDKMEHPQLIVFDNKVINTDQYLDWSTSRPRKCFPFKYNLEPKLSTVLQIKAQTPNHYYDDACTRRGDIEIIEEDQNLSWEIRSNIIYQSRLQQKLKTPQIPAAYEPKRKLILLTGKDLLKRAKY